MRKRIFFEDIFLLLVTLFAIALITCISISAGSDRAVATMGFIAGCTVLLFTSLKQSQEQILGKLEEISKELRKERRDDDDRKGATSD